MHAPATYAEWSTCLDALERGLDDAGAFAAMRTGRLGWSSGVAERFAERIAGVFDTRLSRCSNRLERDLHTGADEVTLVRALGDTRRTLGFLHAVAGLPAFPDLLRTHLADSVKAYAVNTQQSLEDSARQDRSGRIASLLRNNTLLRYDAPALPDSGSVRDPVPAVATAGVRRRNILA